MYQSRKTTRALYPTQAIRNLHQNVRRYDWAREKAGNIVAQADFYLSYGIDRIARDMSGPTQPRSYAVNETYGCPICGEKMLAHGSYSWDIDFVAHPWKIACPHCGNLFPSNDFEAYFRSGQDEHGLFSYDRADKSLLVNTLYPDMGPDFAVDDGHGWVKDPEDPEHGTFMMIPYYIHFGQWYVTDSAHSVKPLGTERKNMIIAAIRILANAYLLTGRRDYGTAAAMLIHKIAWVWSRVSGEDCPWSLGYRLSHGHTGKGRFSGCIWDSMTACRLTEWYDMVWDCVDDAFAAHLRENPVRYFGDAPQSGAEAKAHIEGMLMQFFPDARVGTLHCNPGPVQALLLKTAKVLERDDLFEEYADYIFGAHPESAGDPLMDMNVLLTDLVDRDGFAGESSPGYNSLWANGFMEMAPLLKGHKYDLYKNSKFLKLGDMVRNYSVCDDYMLHIGDHAACGVPGISADLNTQVQYFLATGNKQDARMLTHLAGDGPISTDWFADCGSIDASIRSAAGDLPFHSDSGCFPSYGLAKVQSHPDGKDPESVAVTFGQNFGHSHRDTLNLHLHGFGIDLMPDHGYPAYADMNASRFRWTSNMISHNTAMIPQTEPFSEEIQKTPRVYAYQSLNAGLRGGQLRHYLAGKQVSVIDVEAPALYNADFRRTVVTVDTDGKSRYLVDLFFVGGEHQRLSYHAAGATVETEGTAFWPQWGGTYAGADVPYMDDSYSRAYADGFNYLKDVSRSPEPDPGFTVDWKCEDFHHVWQTQRDVHVKLHVLSRVEEAALCIGQPPQTKPENPRELGYLVLKHGAGAAQFATVIEPYEGASFIASAVYGELETKRTVTVTHKTGRVDAITVDTASGKPFLTVVTTSPDGTTKRFAHGETIVKGKVVEFTKDITSAHFVTVRFDRELSGLDLVGKCMDIAPSDIPNAFYEIKSVEALGGGLYRLGTGDCTFVSRYLDRKDKTRGYRYFIAEDAAVFVAL